MFHSESLKNKISAKIVICYDMTIKKNYASQFIQPGKYDQTYNYILMPLEYR